MNEFQQKLEDFRSRVSEVADELQTAIYEKWQQSHTDGFVVGMSGGLDCTVVAALCAKAGVPVVAVTMPYEANTSRQRQKGIDDATLFCEQFQIPLMRVDISQAANAVIQSAQTDSMPLTLRSSQQQLSKANVLPRMRMTHLYYLAQLSNRLVIGTGNLSEIVMGYFTKWGDGASDFNPIKEITKSEMFILAEYLGLPKEILTKKPSADLWEHQTDEAEMGLSYIQIDTFILTGQGEEKVKEKIQATLRRNQHKYEFNLLRREILERLLKA